jgi:hypothetical protein
VRLLQRACQYIGLPWNGHKVDMVRHQAVAEEGCPMLLPRKRRMLPRFRDHEKRVSKLV